MARHTIIGAGPTGVGLAHKLCDAGHDVTMVTRSGSGPRHDGIRLVAADASDGATLATVARGSTSLYNCANPPYNRWSETWPPISAATISAAHETGARLVIMSNLYGFGPGSSPMSATDDLHPTSRKGKIRAQMWHDALSAHNDGSLAATEVRASDFFGPGIGDSHLGQRATGPALQSRTVRLAIPTDVAHSWTYIGDVTQTLFHAGTDDRAPGRAWHVPTLAPATATEMIHRLCQAAKLDPVAVKQLPSTVLRFAGWFIPALSELAEMNYQFESWFEIDAADTTETFGQRPTPLQDQLAAIITAST